MNDITMTRCKTCDSELKGRSDKKFCNQTCSNAYWNSRRLLAKKQTNFCSTFERLQKSIEDGHIPLGKSKTQMSEIREIFNKVSKGELSASEGHMKASLLYHKIKERRIKTELEICKNKYRQKLEEKWIDVNTDMPKHGVKVIVQHETSNGKDHAFGVYHKDVDMWFYFDGSWKPKDSIEVTHWMPDLPII